MTYWNTRLHPIWTGLLLLLGSGLALAESATPIPVAELGARADAQSPTPNPLLTEGRATLAAPLQALQGELDAAGLVVESTSETEGGGRFRLTPRRLDKGGPAVDLPSGRVSVQGRTAILDRGPLSEILTASGDGLRQDFVVVQAPTGDGPLTLTLALEGAAASPSPTGVALMLPGGRKLVYGGLHITDADGQVLEGTLTATDDRTLTIAVADAKARYPLTIDPTISDADWQALNSSLPGANGSTNIAYDSVNNRLYVGGTFNAIGTILANNIALWDGSAWSALDSGVDRRIFALAVSGENLYVGGNFSIAGGIAANNIAKWDGHTWSALGDGLDGSVYSLAVSGTDLYAGGYFAEPSRGIAKWNGRYWSGVGGGVYHTGVGSVHALAVSGSDLYVGGYFTKAGGTPANYIAKWNGTTWSALGRGVDLGEDFTRVDSLTVSGGDLYVGGRFTQAGAISANHIAKWNGITWSSLGGGLDGNASALAVSSDSLYVSGDFTKADGRPANYIAKWDGYSWSALGNGLSAPADLAVSGSNLYIGGSQANGIAKWDGNVWSTLGSGVNDTVVALAVSNGELYVGGDFISPVSGTVASHIAKWDGSTWSALGSGLNDTVRALAVSGENLYVGGDFTKAGGHEIKYIAKWNGSDWSALGSGVDDKVNAPYISALTVSGSNLYVGGAFDSAGGSTANNIAKWDGLTWSPLGRGVSDGGYYGHVNALAISGSDLYVGGSFPYAFNDVGYVNVNGIAKWDGRSWSALDSGVGYGSVRALAISGTDLYVGGNFTRVGSNALQVNGIAKWNGSTWLALGKGLYLATTNSTAADSIYVSALAVSGSDLYVGGRFTHADDIVANHIAKWNGSVWSALGTGVDLDHNLSSYDRHYISSLALFGDNLYVGGNFFIAGGQFSPYVAYINLGTESFCWPCLPNQGGWRSTLH